MLRTLGGNLLEFIENLDALHSYLALSYEVRIRNASQNSKLLREKHEMQVSVQKKTHFSQKHVLCESYSV